MAGEWSDNLAHQRAVGYVMAGLALADDDPRAAELAEKAWNYYYELVYPWCADFWSGLTGGGQQDWGYQWGRWQANMLNVVLAGQFAFADATYPGNVGRLFLARFAAADVLVQPRVQFHPRPELSDVRRNLRSQTLYSRLAAAGHYVSSGSGRRRGGYWWRNFGMHANYRDGAGIRSAVWIAPYYYESETGTTGAKRPIRGLSTTPPISAPAAPSGWLSAARTGAGPPP